MHFGNNTFPGQAQSRNEWSRQMNLNCNALNNMTFLGLARLLLVYCWSFLHSLDCLKFLVKPSPRALPSVLPNVLHRARDIHKHVQKYKIWSTNWLRGRCKKNLEVLILHVKFLTMRKNAKKNLVPPYMVQNLYSERELSIKLLLGEKITYDHFRPTHTYMKLTLVSFFCTFP